MGSTPIRSTDGFHISTEISNISNPFLRDGLFKTLKKQTHETSNKNQTAPGSHADRLSHFYCVTHNTIQ